MGRFRQVAHKPHDASADELELKSFNRTLAEIEWLLLILILVYLFVPGTSAADRTIIVFAGSGFALFVLLFRYFNLLTESARWKLALETWVMILLIAFVVMKTGGSESPLLNLYLLVIVFSALTLGKMVTLLEVALVTAFYLLLVQTEMGSALYSYAAFSAVMVNFAPFLLVAYITSLLAADMVSTRDIVMRLSETDELTGVLNMRAFAGRLAHQIRESEADGSSFAVMMIDSDRLKSINDELGHEVGNRLIQSVVTSIRQGLRSTDIVARYGGDEFVALLPGGNESAAREAGERVRATVENTSFDVGGQRVSTTVSVGFAVYPDMATSAEDLLARADQALYAGKQGGRNCVRSYADVTVDQPEAPTDTD